MYYVVWKKFNQFYIKLDSKPNSWEERLVLFTAYLVDHNFKSSTVKSYISAVCSVLSELKIKLNEDTSLITSLTQACRLINDQMKTKLPIHKGLFKLILKKIDNYYGQRLQPYLTILYKSLFSTAYYGLFRVGELMQSPHAILAQNVHIAKK